MKVWQLMQILSEAPSGYDVVINTDFEDAYGHIIDLAIVEVSDMCDGMLVLESKEYRQ